MTAQEKEDKRIKKLQKQIEDFQRELTLEKKQKDIIKDYKMVEGDYQILIQIHEASELMPRGTDFFLFKTQKSACDAFVEIQICGQTQRTRIRKDTNNPIFAQKFQFKFQKMTLQQLDRSTINFKIYDHKAFLLPNSLIGSFQLDWTNVYFKRNHQIYQGWITLMDPNDQQQGVMGYLLVSIAVLGKDDKITIHNSAFIKDPLTTIEDTITMPKLQLIDYGINIQIYRAQNLVPLDQYAQNVDAYVIAKFSGNKVQTSIKASCNPQWDQLIRIGTGVPTKSKYITLQVRNRNILTNDDIIGVIKIPFVDLQAQSTPRWGHLYGPPITGKDIQPYNYATKMQMFGEKLGSHYRGRLLYKITGQKDIINKNSRSKITFKFPFKPTPIVPLKSYTLCYQKKSFVSFINNWDNLQKGQIFIYFYFFFIFFLTLQHLRVELLDGFSLPQIGIGQLSKCYIHLCIGQYMVVSRPFGKPKNKAMSFFQRIPDKKIQFPQDITQIPDLILYFAKGERQKDRISFVRIPSKDLVRSEIQNPIVIHRLKGDLTLNNFQKDQPGGFICARAHLFLGQPPQSKYSLLHEFGAKTGFHAKIFLYRARNLPPMNESGDCDPKIVFHFCNAEQKILPDQSTRTYNPIWNKVIDLQFQTEDFMNIQIEKALICNVFDEQQLKSDGFIGNFMIKLTRKHLKKYQGKNNKIQFLYMKPKWYPIINQKVDIGDPCFGHMLIGCAVFRKQHLEQFNKQDIRIIQPTTKKLFQLFLLGARGFQQQRYHLQNKKVYFQIKVGQKQKKETSQYDIKLNSITANQMISLQAQIPKNKSIGTYVDIKLFEKGIFSSTFIGFSCVKLSDLVPKILDEQNGQGNENQDSQSQDTLIDLDELEQQLNLVKARKKQREQLAKGKQTNYKQNLTVENMLVPKQLLSTTNDESVKNQRLDQILQKQKQQIQEIQQYNYIRQVQKQNDQKMLKVLQNRMSESKGRKSEQNIIHQQNEEDQQKLSLKREQNNQNKKKKQSENSSRKSLSHLESAHQQQKSQKSKQNRKQQQNMKIPLKRQSQNYLQIQQSQQNIRKEVDQVKNRFEVDSDNIRKTQSFKQKQRHKGADQVINNFEIHDNSQFSQIPHDERAVKYKDIQRIIRQQEKFTKQAMERQENYKYAAAVKLSLFKWRGGKKDNRQVQTYQDYDTDPQESLDIIPQWYKNRKILATDFQQLVPNKNIKSLPIYQGGNRISNLDIRQKKIAGYIKCIGLAVQQQQKQDKTKRYLKLLKPRSYVCRIYILKGKSLVSNYNKKPTTFVRISCRNNVYSLEKTTRCKEEYNPQYYICQEIPMQIPGPSTVKIQVMEEMGILDAMGIGNSKVLGYTEIDVQQRHFTKKWHFFTQKKPIQLRNLYSQYGIGSRGRLQVWVDIIQKKNWLSNPPYKIHPPPFDKFQLRVIVWSTKDCVYKNQAFQSNDIVVRGYLGTSETQQTDTHWACRGVGNFNYRFKFDVSYPPKPEDMYSDQFIIQIWDRDIVGYDNLIGQKRINLNKIHRIIEKAVKRKKAVKATMKIKQKGLLLTQKFWFDVYNHKVKDQFGQLQSQGKVQLSFELIPKQIAEESFKNGFGQQQPNVFPTLPEPAGRLNFSLLHPLDFCKQLCGPQLYNKICSKVLCIFVIAIVIMLGYVMLGNIFARLIVG